MNDSISPKVDLQRNAVVYFKSDVLITIIDLSWIDFNGRLTKPHESPNETLD